MELNIFHFDTFERLAVIDEPEETEKKLNYRDHSEFEFIIEATEENIYYFINNNQDIFITFNLGDAERAFSIESMKYTDESKSYIQVFCKSLSNMLNQRIVDGQQIFRGTVEEVLRSFVNANAINPTNVKRKIANLQLDAVTGITDETEETYNNKLLDEALWEIANKFDITFDIFADVVNKRFLFRVWRGIDRSSEQTVNDAVIFAKEFDNVVSQSFTDDMSDYRSTVVIAGEGEGAARTKLVVGDEFVGRKRREMFVDARDLQSDTENLSSSAYETLLRERGKSKQAEFQRVQAFETEIEFNSQFEYEVHYFLGDKVTIRNDEISILMHTRLITVTEKTNKSGYELNIDFGSSTPTLFSKIKKVVKQ